MNMNETQPWFKIASLYLGGALCLPVLLVGYTLCKQYGFGASIISIVMGNLLLFFVGLAIARIAFTLRLPTAALAAHILGKKGIVIFAAVMVVTMIGWSAVLLELMSSQLFLALNTQGILVSSILVTVGTGVLVTISSLRGIGQAGTIAMILAIPVFMTLLYLVRTVMPVGDLLLTPALSTSFAGISLVIAATIALVVDLPTYVRTVNTWRNVVWLLVVTLIIGMVLIESMGAWLACASTKSLIEQMMQGGNIWCLWVTICFIASSWIACMANIYSAAISIQTVYSRMSLFVCTLLVSVCIIALALCGLVLHFVFVLECMGVLLSSLGAIMLCWYLFGMREIFSYISITSWLIGCFVGIAHELGYITLMSNALVGAALCSGILYSIGFLIWGAHE